MSSQAAKASKQSISSPDRWYVDTVPIAKRLIPRANSQRCRNTALSFLAALALFSVHPAAAQSLTNNVAQYMDAQVRVNRFAGSILIAQKRKVLLSQRYGLATTKGGRQSTPDERYPLGSIAKQFTAVAILQLRKKGELQLEDSVCKYISECPAGWQEITILDLLIQTDGIPEVDVSSGRSAIIGADAEASEVVTLLRDRPLESKPGEKFRYASAGYAVLAAVVENVAHEPFLKYLKDHIFDPLGMRDTGYDTRLRRGLRRTRHYHATRSITPGDLSMSTPYITGRLYSTATDLYRWDRALYTEKIVSNASLREMFSPHLDGYGFGWTILKEFDRAADTENGGLNLLSSSIRHYPDEGTCVIVLSNLDYVDAGRISRDLAAILFGKHYEMPAERHGVAINPNVYDSYVGQYGMATGFKVTVTTENESLVIQGTGQEKIELIPESETRFFVNGLDVEITFVKGLNGRAAELFLQQGGRAIPARRDGSRP